MSTYAIRKLCENEVGIDDEDADDEAPDSAQDSDDFNPADAFGGNFDDAYEGGKQKGREEFAREVMKLFSDKDPRTIGEWQKAAYAQAKKSGFHDEPNPLATMLMNLVGEASELFEAYRKGDLNKPCDKVDKMIALGIRPLTCIEEELADIHIRLLDTAEEFGVDLESAVAAKHTYNGSRAYKHGGKLA